MAWFSHFAKSTRQLFCKTKQNCALRISCFPRNVFKFPVLRDNARIFGHARPINQSTEYLVSISYDESRISVSFTRSFVTFFARAESLHLFGSCEHIFARRSGHRTFPVFSLLLPYVHMHTHTHTHAPLQSSPPSPPVPDRSYLARAPRRSWNIYDLRSKVSGSRFME